MSNIKKVYELVDSDLKSCSFQNSNSGMIITSLSGGYVEEDVMIY